MYKYAYAIVGLGFLIVFGGAYILFTQDDTDSTNQKTGEEQAESLSTGSTTEK